MSKKKKVESGTEFVTKRGQTVWNTAAGSIVSDETTGNEKIQISHQGGGNINLNGKVNSEFAPNNKQTLVHGDQFSTTAGNNYSTTKSNKEERVEGDLTIITGSERFFNSPIASDWIEKNTEIAAAKAAPEYNYGAIGNNSDTEYPDGGTPDSESGAVEGGSYQPTTAHADIPAMMEAKAADIAETEREMGVGGNIKMMSAKHVYLQAGTKAVTFDSGVMVPKGRKVAKKYEVDGGKCKTIYTAVPNYESKDTSGSVPFGDVHVSAASKLRVVTGSGGVSIKSAGEVNINSTGRLMLGGAEVAIGGGDKNNAGRVTIISDSDMFQQAGSITTRVAPNINDVASEQHSFKTPKAVFTGDVHIAGNVTVEGSDGITVPVGDVLAGNVSLKTHTHGGVCSGNSNTTAPNGSGSSGGGGDPGGGGGAVDQIIAGNNITISPTGGTGSVTINAADGFSGSYNDLTDVPTTFNTVSSFSGSYNDLTDQPTILDSAAVLGVVAAAGYTTCEGDITSVTAGGYLTGGATSGDATLGIDSACASKWDNAAGVTDTYESNLASDLQMTEDIGGLDAGTTVASLTGQTFSQLFDSLLFPTVYPIVGSNNSTNLSDNVSNLQVIGDSINITLNTTANLGTISLNGVTQGPYAGPVTAASITGSSSHTPSVGPGDTDIDNVSITGHTVTIGSNSWTLTTTFSQGPMPLDSTGADYPAIRYAGGTRTNSTSFEGVYPIKLGLSSGSGDYEDRALVSHSANNIQASQDYSETASIRHRIAISDAQINGRSVTMQQWNPVAGAYADLAASEFATSSTTFTVEGNSVNYTVFTKDSAPGGGDVSGQPLYRITF